MKRILIVFDGTSWYVRHVRAIEHNLELDEKVYHCDKPIGVAHATLDEAVATVRAYETRTSRRKHGRQKEAS